MTREFEFITLTEDGRKQCNLVASLFSTFCQDLEDICPQGREFALVKTKLQEACFFSNKAISLEPKNWKSNENT